MNPNSQTLTALEAVGFAVAGAGLASVGDALVAGQTDWRVILGAALLAGLSKVFPSQMTAPHPAPPGAAITTGTVTFREVPLAAPASPPAPSAGPTPTAPAAPPAAPAG